MSVAEPFLQAGMPVTSLEQLPAHLASSRVTYDQFVWVWYLPRLWRHDGRRGFVSAPVWPCLFARPARGEQRHRLETQSEKKGTAADGEEVEVKSQGTANLTDCGVDVATTAALPSLSSPGADYHLLYYAREDGESRGRNTESNNDIGDDGGGDQAYNNKTAGNSRAKRELSLALLMRDACGATLTAVERDTAVSQARSAIDFVCQSILEHCHAKQGDDLRACTGENQTPKSTPVVTATSEDKPSESVLKVVVLLEGDTHERLGLFREKDGWWPALKQQLMATPAEAGKQSGGNFQQLQPSQQTSSASGQSSAVSLRETDFAVLRAPAPKVTTAAQQQQHCRGPTNTPQQFDTETNITAEPASAGLSAGDFLPAIRWLLARRGAYPTDNHTLTASDDVVHLPAYGHLGDEFIHFLRSVPCNPRVCVAAGAEATAPAGGLNNDSGATRSNDSPKQPERMLNPLLWRAPFISPDRVVFVESGKTEVSLCGWEARVSAADDAIPPPESLKALHGMARLRAERAAGRALVRLTHGEFSTFRVTQTLASAKEADVSATCYNNNSNSNTTTAAAEAEAAGAFSNVVVWQRARTDGERRSPLHSVASLRACYQTDSLSPAPPLPPYAPPSAGGGGGSGAMNGGAPPEADPSNREAIPPIPQPRGAELHLLSDRGDAVFLARHLGDRSQLRLCAADAMHEDGEVLAQLSTVEGTRFDDLDTFLDVVAPSLADTLSPSSAAMAPAPACFTSSASSSSSPSPAAAGATTAVLSSPPPSVSQHSRCRRYPPPPPPTVRGSCCGYVFPRVVARRPTGHNARAHVLASLSAEVETAAPTAAQLRAAAAALWTLSDACVPVRVTDAAATTTTSGGGNDCNSATKTDADTNAAVVTVVADGDENAGAEDSADTRADIIGYTLSPATPPITHPDAGRSAANSSGGKIDSNTTNGGDAAVTTAAATAIRTAGCAWCGRWRERLSRCGGCKCVLYCCRAHQARDWKEGSHRAECPLWRWAAAECQPRLLAAAAYFSSSSSSSPVAPRTAGGYPPLPSGDTRQAAAAVFADRVVDALSAMMPLSENSPNVLLPTSRRVFCAHVVGLDAVQRPRPPPSALSPPPLLAYLPHFLASRPSLLARLVGNQGTGENAPSAAGCVQCRLLVFVQEGKSSRTRHHHQQQQRGEKKDTAEKSSLSLHNTVWGVRPAGDSDEASGPNVVPVPGTGVLGDGWHSAQTPASTTSAPNKSSDGEPSAALSFPLLVRFVTTTKYHFFNVQVRPPISHSPSSPPPPSQGNGNASRSGAPAPPAVPPITHEENTSTAADAAIVFAPSNGDGLSFLSGITRRLCEQVIGRVPLRVYDSCYVGAQRTQHVLRRRLTELRDNNNSNGGGGNNEINNSGNNIHTHIHKNDNSQSRSTEVSKSTTAGEKHTDPSSCHDSSLPNSSVSCSDMAGAPTSLWPICLRVSRHTHTDGKGDCAAPPTLSGLTPDYAALRSARGGGKNTDGNNNHIGCNDDDGKKKKKDDDVEEEEEKGDVESDGGDSGIEGEEEEDLQAVSGGNSTRGSVDPALVWMHSFYTDIPVEKH